MKVFKTKAEKIEALKHAGWLSQKQSNEVSLHSPRVHFYLPHDSKTLCGRDSFSIMLTMPARLFLYEGDEMSKRKCKTCLLGIPNYVETGMAYRDLPEESGLNYYVPKLKQPTTNYPVIEVEASWQKGKCSVCKIEGVFWNGGKKREHRCYKHLVTA